MRDSNEIKSQVEAAIESRDIGTAQDLLNDLYQDNKAAGLVTVYPPKPGSPESIRKRLLKSLRSLIDEIDSGDMSTDEMTDPENGTVWMYSEDGNGTECYKRVG